MKRLLTIAAAVLLALSASVRGEGPDDRYIDIYRLIQEGDQLAATARPELAREKYTTAQAELKKLQKSYPSWNTTLVEFRLRMLDTKLTTNAAPTKAVKPPGQTGENKAVPPQSPSPSQAEPGTPPAAPAPAPAPAPVLATPAEIDDRDAQIRALQEQVGRLQNQRSVLESKLSEALSARPASVDPQELVRAEERIRALEKEKEILNVSVQVAETKAAQHAETDELKRALADAKQRLGEQNDAIMALRQEKDMLQQRVQTAKRADDDALNSLRAENDALRKNLAEKAAAPQPPPAGEPLEKELASTKDALQSSREAMASLQVRVRTLQEERDQLDKTRKELETKLASNSAAAPAGESAQVRRLQKEKDELQKRLNEVTKQMAENKKSRSSQSHSQPAAEDVSGLHARIEALEARKVPYTPEELALLKKPQEPVVLTAAAEPAQLKEPPAAAAPLLAEAQRAFAARRFDEAEKKYLEVLNFDEKNVATLQRLAATQLEQNRPKDAEATLQRALQENPRDARSLLLMGIAKFDQDKFDEALDNLSRSSLADPQNAETQNYLGITLSQKGQRAAAETALRRAVQLNPNYASAHHNLAFVYATQQPPFTELARWHYQKALAYGHPANSELEKLIERKDAAQK